jgi:Ca2+-binding EF-hand superfamily protein
MYKIRGFALTLGAIAGFIAVGVLPHAAGAQKVDKSAPKQERTLLLGQDEVEQLLFLMDTDKNGKISKKEFLDFMSAEFDRLDKDKSGELDPKELMQSQIRPAARPALGK